MVALKIAWTNGPLDRSEVDESCPTHVLGHCTVAIHSVDIVILGRVPTILAGRTTIVALVILTIAQLQSEALQKKTLLS